MKCVVRARSSVARIASVFWVVGAVLVAGPAAAQPPAPVQRAAAPAPPAPPPPQAAATGGDELISPYGEPGTAPPGATAGAPAAPEAQVSTVVVPKRPATTRMMLLGAGLGLFTGLVLVDLRDIDDGSIATVGVLGTTAGFAGIGYLAADRLEVTSGQAQFAMVGTLIGAANGALLAKPLELSGDSEDWGPFVLATTTVGAVGGLVLGRSADYTPGQSTFTMTVAASGLYSMLLGVAIAQDGDLEDDEGALVALTIGLDAGVIGGALLAPRIDWSPGRARFVGGATVVGAASGISTGALITGDERDIRVLGTAGLVGLWGGMLGGMAISSGWDPDERYRSGQTTASSLMLTPVVGDERIGLAMSGTF